MPKRPKNRSTLSDSAPVTTLPALKLLEPRLHAPLCIRFSEEQRQRLHRAAVVVTKERGAPIDDSTLARELVMRGVSKLID